MNTPNYNFHKARTEILNEAFSRQEYPIETGISVIRLAFLCGDDAKIFESCNKDFFDACLQNSLWIKQGDFRQYRVELSDTVVTWEKHTEFVTLTWSIPSDSDIYAPEINSFIECFTPLDLLVATKINLFALKKEDVEVFEQNYDLGSFSAGYINDGKARIATDFKTNDAGFVTYDVGILEANPTESGILVRRVLEFETYRIFALLGLPTARLQMPKLAELEDRFSRLLKLTQSTNHDTEKTSILADFQSLSLELDHIAQNNRFRFAATAAYAEIFWQRLKSLNITAIGNFRRPDRFTKRRMEPAISTCARIKEREEELAIKINQAVELINMQNSEKIQSQNTMILKSMNETSSRQYKLQKTVEGLSVIAITYYLVGLLSYIYSGMKDVIPLEKTIFLALSVPIVLIIVWLFIHIVKRRHK